MDEGALAPSAFDQSRKLTDQRPKTPRLKSVDLHLFMTATQIKSELRALFRLGLPIAVAELSGMAMAVITTFMLGQTGATPVAAVGAVNPIFWLVALVGLGSLSMTSPLVAAANERGDTAEIKRILVASSIMALLFALLQAVLLSVLNLNFHILGHDPEVAVPARPFLWALIGMLPFMMLFNNLIFFADGLSLTKVGMVFSLSSIGVGVLLNWLLIYGNVGFPQLGLLGAGISMMLSTVFQFGGMLWYLRRAAVFRPFLKTPVGAAAVLGKMRAFAAVSLPVGLQTAVEISAYAVGAVWAGHLGKYPLAAHQVAITLAGSTFVVLMAIGSAGAIRIGQAMGQDDRAQMRLSGFSAMLLAVGLVSLPALSFLCFPQALARFFVNEPEVWGTATSLIVIAGFFQLSDAVQSVGISLLRGLEDTKLPSLISLVAYWVLGLPIGYWLAFRAGWGVQGIWVSFLIALTTQALWFTLRFSNLSRRVQRLKSDATR
jgi:multidrug resistance protein, MATE family